LTFGGISREEFLAQYVPATEKLQRFYSHVTLEAIITRSNPQHKGAERERLIVRADGDRLRVDGFVHDKSGGETVRVTVTSADTSFTLRRNTDQDNFVLSHLASDTFRDRGILRSRYYYVFAPFSENGGIILLEKIRSSNFKITSIDEEERNGEELVKVAYEREIRFNDKSATYSGYDVFSKTMCWALRESLAGNLHGRIEYDGIIDGVPLLKSAEYWRQEGDQRVNVVRCEVTKIEPTAPPPEMFELATLVGDVRHEGKSWLWLVLIIGGVVLVAIGVVLARLAMRRRAVAS
jgi:hypothetical protein